MRSGRKILRTGIMRFSAHRMAHLRAENFTEPRIRAITSSPAYPASRRLPNVRISARASAAAWAFARCALATPRATARCASGASASASKSPVILTATIASLGAPSTAPRTSKASLPPPCDSGRVRLPVAPPALSATPVCAFRLKRGTFPNRRGFSAAVYCWV